MFWNGNTAIDGLSGSARPAATVAACGRSCGSGTGSGWRRPHLPRFRDNRSDIAIAPARTGLDPTIAARNRTERPPHRRDLNCQVALLDGLAGPRGIDQGVLREPVRRAVQPTRATRRPPADRAPRLGLRARGDRPGSKRNGPSAWIVMSGEPSRYGIFRKFFRSRSGHPTRGSAYRRPSQHVRLPPASRRETGTTTDKGETHVSADQFGSTKLHRQDDPGHDRLPHGSAMAGPSCSRIPRTSRRSAPPSSATWPA